jgi:hypothetical protein
LPRDYFAWLIGGWSRDGQAEAVWLRFYAKCIAGQVQEGCEESWAGDGLEGRGGC